MMKKVLLILSAWILITQSSTAFATTFCSYGNSYLNVGMSMSDVKNACGAPLSKSKKKVFDTRNVAVQQLFYTFRSTSQKPNAFNSSNQAQNELNLMVSIIAQKVNGMSLNSNATQGVSVCPNGPIQIDSSLSSVLRACGQPNYVNTSYQKVSQNNVIEQEIWVIKASQYSNNITLTFSNGVLRSIQ